MERTETSHLDGNRYTTCGDASFSTYTVTANIPALRAGDNGRGRVGHTNGGDDEKERLCMMPILLAVHTTSRAHHTSLVSFHSTAAPAGLHSRPDSVVASAEQASEPRAGLRMVHSTYRKDLRAGVASPADQLAPAILLPSHHASKATLCGQMCALRASRAPLVRAVDVPGAVAGPGTLGTAPAGPPGPRRSLDGPDIGAVPPSGFAHH